MLYNNMNKEKKQRAIYVLDELKALVPNMDADSLAQAMQRILKAVFGSG